MGWDNKDPLLQGADSPLRERVEPSTRMTTLDRDLDMF